MVMARRVGVTAESIRNTLRRFKGVEHRIEFVASTKEDVRFYNDSKATNVDSLEKALLSFDRPIILVAGGRDKASAYDRLNHLVKERVRALVLIGEATPVIKKHWGRLVPTREAATMDEAVKVAAGLAQPHDVVLLSPACSSFDMYKDFEERGCAFKRSVRSFLGI